MVTDRKPWGSPAVFVLSLLDDAMINCFSSSFSDFGKFKRKLNFKYEDYFYAEMQIINIILYYRKKRSSSNFLRYWHDITQVCFLKDLHFVLPLFKILRLQNKARYVYLVKWNVWLKRWMLIERRWGKSGATTTFSLTAITDP